VRAIGWKDGKVHWTAPDNISQGGSMLRIGDKLILLTERGKLILAKATAAGYTKLGDAKVCDGGQIWSSPVVYNGKVYVKGTEELLCLDLR
jgi:hypothetical protein